MELKEILSDNEKRKLVAENCNKILARKELSGEEREALSIAISALFEVDAALSRQRQILEILHD